MTQSEDISQYRTAVLQFTDSKWKVTSFPLCLSRLVVVNLNQHSIVDWKALFYLMSSVILHNVLFIYV